MLNTTISKPTSLRGLISYSTDKHVAANLEAITAERAKQIIEMNRKGEKPLSLQEDGKKQEPERPLDLATQENINRFDKAKKKKKKHKKPNNGGGNANQSQRRDQKPKDAKE